MLTVVKHSIQRSLGIKRTIWQKVLPAFTIAISFIPAIVYIGLAALIPADNRPDDLLPSYAEYYGFITTGLVVFTSFVAPEVLCTDRRTGHARPVPRLAARPQHVPRQQGGRGGVGAGRRDDGTATADARRLLR